MSMMKSKGVNMEANGPAPDAAACLYEGKVMHQRMRPFGHRFTYRVFSLMIDLDRLSDAEKLSPLFSINRRNWVSFHEADHLDPEEQDLAAVTRKRFSDSGLRTPIARILLVCYPRIFGHVFNPLSVYYGYDAEGRLCGLIYEVSNTFGGRHRYVCPVAKGEIDINGIHQTADKVFHVSPFIAMDMRYHFRMLPPGKEIRWRILETSPEGPLLSATFSGTNHPLKSKVLAGLCARIPFLTASILLGIHWEALKLWLKGAKFIPDPGKTLPTPDSSQLPKPNFDPKLDPDASSVHSGESTSGRGLYLQLKR